MSPASGLEIVGIVWITAILVLVLVILGEMFSGNDGGDSSRQSSDFAYAPGVGVEAQKKAEKTKTATPEDDRSQRTLEQIPGDSHSAAQPGDTGGRAPVITPRPKPPPAPRPKPPRAPPETPVPSQPPVSESPSAPVTVANNNDGP
jgi:hypothetical protein